MDIGSMAVSKSPVPSSTNAGERARPPRKIVELRETRRYMRGWSCLGKRKTSSRSSLAIRRQLIAVLLTGEETRVPAWGVRQARIRLAETFCSGLGREGTKRASGTSLLFRHHGLEHWHGVKVTCIRIEQDFGRNLLWLAFRPSCPRGDPQGCLGKAQPRLFLCPDIKISNDFRDRWVLSWIPRRERLWKHRRTIVEFLSPPMTCQQAEGRRIVGPS
ncbi:hypothetical protein GWK47_000303 [Chionoecetes opilio]|uniref:Uncharacterized protein n=1 Tax=Chionoecetes opilio TaxID=41210 RepID=A0A8J4YSY1_CHIOP|nr:hypothetical protein GWK47_000303 [Chionoecetes opilio]